eukprot:5257962-Pyramimonas_sp.AAC.1
MADLPGPRPTVPRSELLAYIQSLRIPAAPCGTTPTTCLSSRDVPAGGIGPARAKFLLVDRQPSGADKKASE